MKQKMNVNFFYMKQMINNTRWTIETKEKKSEEWK